MQDVREEGENPSIGIILCAEKDETIVKYLEGKMVEYPDIIQLNTDLYSMSVTIDYKKLHKNYIKIMNDILC